MNCHSSLFKCLAMLSLLAAPARTQEVSAESPHDRPRLMAEMDPATFAMSGYSGHVRVALGNDSKWVLGFGVYGLDFPKAIVDFNPKNRDKGWDVRLTFGAGLFADRFMSTGNEGAFVGVQVASQQYRIRNPKLGPRESQYTSLLLMPRVGYLWKPGTSGFYLMPWMGVGYADKVSGTAQVANVDYHLSKVMAFAAVHAGWRF